MKKQEKIEKEIRFVLTDAEYEMFKKNAQSHASKFKKGKAVIETTTMYDNPNPEYTFYSKEVDGRLRVRTSRPGNADIFASDTETSTAMLTWKQRVPEYNGNLLCQEKEIEAVMTAEDMDAVVSILENVLRCPRVSAYERNRETFYTDGVEIAADTFPYGHVIELEVKNNGTEEELYEVARVLGLDNCRPSVKSCDDMYRWLCEQTGRTAKNDIMFADADMPKLDEVFGGE